MKPVHYLSTAVIAALLGGCAAQQETTSLPGSGPGLSSVKVSNPSYRPESPWLQEPGTLFAGDDGDIWTLIEGHLAFADKVPEARIQRQLTWLEGNQAYFDNTLDRASLYLPYILDRVIAAELPAEVAILPFIESAYDPFARSPSGAAGLWQFIANTGDHFGLERNRWYEGRRDIIDSTDAAIEYLTHLNEAFDGDWLLTFAAYNCGPGTLRQAIEENERKGLATDFWSLELPEVTRRYVPRLVAVSRALLEPDAFGIERPAMAAASTLQVVEFEGSVDIAQAARILDMDAKSIYRLNPGYTRWVTPPMGPHRLILPAKAADRFAETLAQLPEQGWRPSDHYVVKQGDTLNSIARQAGLPPADLARLNNLDNGEFLRAGQQLRLPATEAPAAASAAVASYEVQRGDSVWSIARAHNLKARDLLAWNSLPPDPTLQPGQVLRFYAEGNPPAPAPAGNYQVQDGDSLYRIARRFNVGLDQLLAWNDLGSDTYIQPGQKLRIYRTN